MERNISDVFQKYIKKSKKRKRRERALSIVSIIVLIATTIVMILPAISTSNRTFCGLDEHIHTDQCYTTELAEGADCYTKIQICQKEEHAHTLRCMADTTADIETMEDWEKAFAEISISGNKKEDILAIAVSQLGYSESKSNYIVGEDGQTVYKYNRYGVWLGEPYSEWNTAFVSFCAFYANIDTVPKTNQYAQLRAAVDVCYVPFSNGKPEKGMIAFIDGNQDGEGETVGIVSNVVKNTELECEDILVIQGDQDGFVELLKYHSNEQKILGYADYPDTAVMLYANAGSDILNTGSSGSATESLTYENITEEAKTDILEVRFATYIGKSDLTAQFPLLKGAQLALYIADENVDTFIPNTTVKGTLIEQWVSEDVHGTEGGFHSMHLNDGTYYLREEVTPEHYVGLYDAIIFTVDVTNCKVSIIEYPGYDRIITQTTDNGVLVGTTTVDFPIYNTAIYRLPDTGGSGTNMYITGGIALIIVSVFFLFYKRVFYRLGSIRSP